MTKTKLYLIPVICKRQRCNRLAYYSLPGARRRRPLCRRHLAQARLNSLLRKGVRRVE